MYSWTSNPRIEAGHVENQADLYRITRNAFCLLRVAARGKGEKIAAATP
jgi:hypothetical protein